MKKTLVILPALLLFFSSKPAATRAVKLENPILSMIDGQPIGINGENLSLTYKYQSDILTILLGAKTKNGRQGAYEFEGKKYSVKEIQKIEEELGNQATPAQQAELKRAMRKMRDDFEAISEEFKEMGKAAKPVITSLIEESCQKRNRGNDCLILIWTHSKEDEYTLFDRQVRTIKDFEIFMIDLYNFLGDLVASCPIAQKQFKERLDKFTQIRKFVPSLSLNAAQEQKFLKYVQKNLHTITMDSINAAKIKELYNASKRS